MTFNVRCSRERCKARRVFSKHPDEYVRVPKCKGCGGKLYRVIPDRQRDRCAELCTCWGLWWTVKGPPHRKGCRGCEHHVQREFLVDGVVSDVPF